MNDLKPGGQRVKFGELANCVNDRVDDPSTAGVERYVGLEHLDPESLTIRRWGSPEDVESTKLRFKPGDIIFGKRRAYQRKLAVADFEGICSAHAMVLRAKPAILLPEFLPFLMQSDLFMERAVEISVGSLSPTINWKTLAQQEFALPPLAVQKDIVEALRSNDLLIENLREAGSAANKMVSSVIRDTFLHMNTWTYTSLNSLGDVDLGRQKSPKYTQGLAPKPYLKVGNIKDWRLDYSEIAMMDFEGKQLSKYRLEEGDILLTEGDIVSPLNVGRSAMFDGSINDCCFQNHLIRFRAKPEILPWFALGLFRVLHMNGEFARAAKVTTVTSLGVQRMAAMQVPLPPSSLRSEIAETMERIWSVDAVIGRRLAAARAQRQVLLNTLLV